MAVYQARRFCDRSAVYLGTAAIGLEGCGVAVPNGGGVVWGVGGLSLCWAEAYRTIAVGTGYKPGLGEATKRHIL